MNTGKIKIGITYTGTELKHNNYVNWIKGNEDIEIIKLSAEDNNLDKVQEVHGIIMSGGIDVNPKHYGSTITDYDNAPEKFNDARDDFEMAVFNSAQQHHIPVLAICRGMQLVNCILGGDLQQDLGEEKNKQHRLVDENKKHDIFIEPGTLLHSITGKEKDIADSAHHQCINRLAQGLLINARSQDDIAEGIEWKEKEGKPFLLGVQWHPERMYMQNIQASTLSKNIRECFLRAVTKNI